MPWFLKNVIWTKMINVDYTTITTILTLTLTLVKIVTTKKTLVIFKELV